MGQVDCQKVLQLEESYLLGELEEGEMRDIHLHLKQCLSCRKRLGSQQELLGRLFEAVTPVTPPSSVRNSIMGQVKGSKLTQARQKLNAPKRPFFKPLLGVGFARSYGAVVSLLLIVAMAWGINAQNQLQDLSTRQTQDRQLLGLTAASDNIIWVMQQPGKNFKPGAPTAKMYVRPGGDFYYVTAAHLVAAPTGESYRVWYNRGGVTEFGGDLQLDAGGNAYLEITDPTRSGTKVDKCFITLENFNTPPVAPLGAPLLEWKEQTFNG